MQHKAINIKFTLNMNFSVFLSIFFSFREETMFHKKRLRTVIADIKNLSMKIVWKFYYISKISTMNSSQAVSLIAIVFWISFPHRDITPDASARFM